MLGKFIRYLMREQLKKTYDVGFADGKNLGFKTGRASALHEMVDLGQGYKCKHCGISLAEVILEQPEPKKMKNF